MGKNTNSIMDHFDQFIVDKEGKRLAIIATPESFDAFLEDLRTHFNGLLKEAGIEDTTKYPTLEELKEVLFSD